MPVVAAPAHGCTCAAHRHARTHTLTRTRCARMHALRAHTHSATHAWAAQGTLSVGMLQAAVSGSHSRMYITHFGARPSFRLFSPFGSREPTLLLPTPHHLFRRGAPRGQAAA